MIVAGPDGFQKSQYRKFNIKSDAGAAGDDYGMMREVLTRRFKRLVESSLTAADLRAGARAASAGAGEDARVALLPDPSGEEGEAIPQHLDSQSRPELVLIDGGAGQLQVALDVMAELGLTDVAVVGVAKGPDRDAGREHFHIPGRPRSLMLEPRDPVLYFVQRLRDEAHRFAIGAHRAKRSKALTVNPLDEIDGIGPTRKRALLSHFGSAKSVSRASVGDLQTVPGISADLAQRIYDFFNERRG
jgi:excinuclease ABC subunit C